MSDAMPTTPHRIVTVDDTRIAIAETCIVGTADGVPTTSTPLTPRPVAGLTNHEGTATVVVDLRAAIGLDDHEPLDAGPVLFIETAEGRLGLRVERIDGTADIATDRLQPTPMTMIPAARRVLSGLHVADGEVSAVLDPSASLATLGDADDPFAS